MALPCVAPATKPPVHTEADCPHPAPSDKEGTVPRPHVMGPHQRLLNCIVPSKWLGEGRMGGEEADTVLGLRCHLGDSLGQPLACL